MNYQFQWDEGNLNKLSKVRMSGRNFTVSELESVFDDKDRYLVETYPDEKTGEERYIMVGLSNQNRIVSVIFVLRGPLNDQIRIFNCWKTKQTVLKLYHEHKANNESEATAHPEAGTAEPTGD